MSTGAWWNSTLMLINPSSHQRNYHLIDLMFIYWPPRPVKSVDERQDRSSSAEDVPPSFHCRLSFSLVKRPMFSLHPSADEEWFGNVKRVATAGGGGQFSAFHHNSLWRCNQTCPLVFTYSTPFISSGPHLTVSDGLYLKCNLCEV